MPPEKDPAAVALGRKRIAKMSDAERKTFHQAGAQAAAEANRKRTPEERRRIARQANLTRQRMPSWMKRITEKKAPAISHDAGANQGSGVSKPGLDVPEIIHLARAIDDLPDEIIEKLADALSAGRFLG